MTGFEVNLPVAELADELIAAVVARLDRDRPAFRVPKLALTPKETAEALSISEPVVRDLIAKGEIAHVRVGRRIVVPVSQLERWLDTSAAVRARIAEAAA
jgi:excisionase family DNA binding protein